MSVRVLNAFFMESSCVVLDASTIESAFGGSDASWTWRFGVNADPWRLAQRSVLTCVCANELKDALTHAPARAHTHTNSKPVAANGAADRSDMIREGDVLVAFDGKLMDRIKVLVGFPSVTYDTSFSVYSLLTPRHHLTTSAPALALV